MSQEPIRERQRVEVYVEPERAVAYRKRGWWRDETLIDDMRLVSARHPDKVAIASHFGSTGHTEAVTFEQVVLLADRFAGALLELGVGPGEIVSFQLPNWWQVPLLQLACMRIGAVANPILPILRRREVSFILERTGARICIVPAEFKQFDYADMASDIKASLGSLEHVFVLGGEGPADTKCFEPFFLETRWEDKYSPTRLDALRLGPDAPTQLMFTSGTTGEPKGVVHSNNTLDIGLRAIPDAMELTNDDVVLMFSPLSHQIGYLFGLFMPLKYGMKVIYQDIWDPDTMLRLIERERATWTMGSAPFALDACAAVDRNPGVDLSSFTKFACGGAPIPPKAVAEARRQLGAQLLPLWGMTEIGVGTTTRAADSDDRVTNSDGLPLDWVEIKVVDAAGQPLPPCAEGRLLVRTPSQHLAYYGRPDLYAASFCDEWFDTGDLAQADADGYIRITGRTKDLIIRGGENIPVAEVEALMYEHPAIREVAVVAYPDERLGERACAVVVPVNGQSVTLDDICSHLNAQGCAKSFWPERLEIRETLPRTAAGKIQKFVLREELRRVMSLEISIGGQ